MIHVYALLELVTAATATSQRECPNKVAFDLNRPERLSWSQGGDVDRFAHPMVIHPMWFQVYDKQPSLKNGRSWYRGADDDALGIYWCPPYWAAAPVANMSKYLSAETQCFSSLLLITAPYDDLPHWLRGKAIDEVDGCVDFQEDYLSGWFNVADYDGHAHLATYMMIREVKEQDGIRWCDEDSQCPGRCDKKTNTCSCEDNNSVYFSDADLGQVLAPEATHRCDVFAKESKDQIAFLCGCYGEVAYFCGVLCGTCGGNGTSWDLETCAARHEELRPAKVQNDQQNLGDDAIVILSALLGGLLVLMSILAILYIHVDKMNRAKSAKARAIESEAYSLPNRSLNAFVARATAVGKAGSKHIRQEPRPAAAQSGQVVGPHSRPGAARFGLVALSEARPVTVLSGRTAGSEEQAAAVRSVRTAGSEAPSVSAQAGRVAGSEARPKTVRFSRIAGSGPTVGDKSRTRDRRVVQMSGANHHAATHRRQLGTRSCAARLGMTPDSPRMAKGTFKTSEERPDAMSSGSVPCVVPPVGKSA